jgi:hypothetical protein
LKSGKSLKTRTKIHLGEGQSEYYDLEMKSNYYDNVLLQLTNICGEDTLENISNYWNNIDQAIEEEYQRYVKQEEELKRSEEEMERLTQQRGTIASKGELGAKTAEEVELEAIEEEMQGEKARLEEL